MSGLAVHDSSTQRKQWKGEVENELLKVEAVNIHSYKHLLERLYEDILFWSDS